jgi:hypothetical protein
LSVYQHNVGSMFAFSSMDQMYDVLKQKGVPRLFNLMLNDFKVIGAYEFGIKVAFWDWELDKQIGDMVFAIGEEDVLLEKYKHLPDIKPMIKPSSDTSYKRVLFDPHSFTYSPNDKVVIIDGDGSPNFPNLALQKISAWEKRNGIKNIILIKLKHQRVKGLLGIHPDTALEIEEIKDADRIYGSFIFTRSKSVAELIGTLLSMPNAFIGGTGVDEYYEMQEGDRRARPKLVTQLHQTIEDMYPDHNLYESEYADQSVNFWNNTGDYKIPKKAKKNSNTYLIKPIDGTWGSTDKIFSVNPFLLDKFDKAMNTYGYEDGTTYRGSTRGNGYSSKGCPRKCTFCVVPVIQGDISPMYYGLLGVINWALPKEGFYPTMDEIVQLYKAGRLYMRPHVFFDAKGSVKRISPFLTISDNNFPADPTCIEKMDYMIENDIAANLNQGMDARLLTAKARTDKSGVSYPSGDEICEKLSKLYFINFNGTARQMHFSWDYIGVGRIVIEGLTKLVKEYGLSYSNFTVYCLSGFNTTFEEDYQRIMTLKKLKIDPYMMLFRNVDGSEGTKFDGTPQDWRMKHLARWTNNKILFRVTTFPKYDRVLKEFEDRERGKHTDELEETEKLDCFDWLTTDYINHA